MDLQMWSLKLIFMCFLVWSREAIPILLPSFSFSTKLWIRWPKEVLLALYVIHLGKLIICSYASSNGHFSFFQPSCCGRYFTFIKYSSIVWCWRIYTLTFVLVDECFFYIKRKISYIWFFFLHARPFTISSIFWLLQQLYL